ncbi:KilA domain-containing protein [Photorhabdus asymbiotica]|uniref:KilA domain-containing protein n=1 Tax=Photorhabdus asymbiotica TaxID=291112 RepID=A0ABX9SND9_9GAMM|nr:KilA domain-containing protein [Photorhabdus asymbiotica]
MHKAGGGKDAKRPKTWLETKQAQELVEELRQNYALGQEVLKVQKGGVNQGTFAHELLAISYAGWISPSFQLQVNQIFFDYRTGKLVSAVPVNNQSGLPEYRLAKAEQLRSVALEKNIASIERLNMLLPNLDRLAKQTLAASVINPLIGQDVIPLPVLEEKYYTAGEVGRMLEVSANKIGRTANNHNLKTEQHGKFFLDKSAHSDKQVEAFRYNENGIKALRHLIHGVEVA